MKRLLLILIVAFALAVATVAPAFASGPPQLICLLQGDQIIGFEIDHDGHGTTVLDGFCPLG